MSRSMCRAGPAAWSPGMRRATRPWSTRCRAGTPRPAESLQVSHLAGHQPVLEEFVAFAFVFFLVLEHGMSPLPRVVHGVGDAVQVGMRQMWMRKVRMGQMICQIGH